jgi:hypothetical protein
MTLAHGRKCPFILPRAVQLRSHDGRAAQVDSYARLQTARHHIKADQISV